MDLYFLPSHFLIPFFFLSHASTRYPTLHKQNLLEHMWGSVLLGVCFHRPQKQDSGTEAGKAGTAVATEKGLFCLGPRDEAKRPFLRCCHRPTTLRHSHHQAHPLCSSRLWFYSLSHRGLPASAHRFLPSFLFLKTFILCLFFFFNIYLFDCRRSSFWCVDSFIVACRMKFPDLGSNPGPLHRELAISTAGSPGKSHTAVFVAILCIHGGPLSCFQYREGRLYLYFRGLLPRGKKWFSHVTY